MLLLIISDLFAGSSSDSDGEHSPQNETNSEPLYADLCASHKELQTAYKELQTAHKELQTAHKAGKKKKKCAACKTKQTTIENLRRKTCGKFNTLQTKVDDLETQLNDTRPNPRKRRGATRETDEECRTCTALTGQVNYLTLSLSNAQTALKESQKTALDFASKSGASKDLLAERDTARAERDTAMSNKAQLEGELLATSGRLQSLQSAYEAKVRDLLSLQEQLQKTQRDLRDSTIRLKTVYEVTSLQSGSAAAFNSFQA